MPTRRQFVQGLAATAATTLVGTLPATTLSVKPPLTYRKDRPLLDLQQEFLDLRLGMFLHFNMATFQDREWGDPTDTPKRFAPSALDTDQWAAAAKSAGMQFACLTTKHHDGFCIWPTKTGVASILDTDHKIDVVRSYVDSFRKAGIKVCLYYSILDLRNDIRHFNVTPAKIQLIKKQLTELLTHYGDITMLIFDGWDAPWSRIPYSEVPFDEIYALVKSLQPNCLICELNASQYPKSALYYTDIKSFEQNAGQHLPEDSQLPAQSCVTLTDGWFWKESDVNGPLKSVDQIVNQWLIPQNKAHCNLIVNAAPNREGRLSDNLVARLKEIGESWTHPGPADKIHAHLPITTPNLATGRPVHASVNPDTFGPDQTVDGSFKSTWYLEEGKEEGWIEIDLGGKEINRLIAVEGTGLYSDYPESRIERYEWILDGRVVAKGSHPTQVQMDTCERQVVKKARFHFWAKTPTPHIAELGLYNEP